MSENVTTDGRLRGRRDGRPRHGTTTSTGSRDEPRRGGGRCNARAGGGEERRDVGTSGRRLFGPPRRHVGTMVLRLVGTSRHRFLSILSMVLSIASIVLSVDDTIDSIGSYYRCYRDGMARRTAPGRTLKCPSGRRVRTSGRRTQERRGRTIKARGRTLQRPSGRRGRTS